MVCLQSLVGFWKSGSGGQAPSHRSVPYYTILQCAKLSVLITLFYTTLYHAILSYTTTCYTALYCTMRYYVTLCYAILYVTKWRRCPKFAQEAGRASTSNNNADAHPYLSCIWDPAPERRDPSHDMQDPWPKIQASPVLPAWWNACLELRDAERQL